MSKYSAEFKSEMVKKVLSSPNRSVLSIASEANLNGSTLHRWVKELKDATISPDNLNAKRPCDWTAAQRFSVLLESAAINPEDLGAFMRKKGIYSHQLKSWKVEFMTDKKNQLSEKQLSELKSLRARNKELERELNRKEKALAETAALLVLKKKADLIWGDKEED